MTRQIKGLQAVLRRYSGVATAIVLYSKQPPEQPWRTEDIAEMRQTLQQLGRAVVEALEMLQGIDPQEARNMDELKAAATELMELASTIRDCAETLVDAADGTATLDDARNDADEIDGALSRLQDALGDVVNALNDLQSPLDPEDR